MSVVSGFCLSLQKICDDVVSGFHISLQAAFHAYIVTVFAVRVISGFRLSSQKLCDKPNMRKMLSPCGWDLTVDSFCFAVCEMSM